MFKSIFLIFVHEQALCSKTSTTSIQTNQTSKTRVPYAVCREILSLQNTRTSIVSNKLKTFRIYLRGNIPAFSPVDPDNRILNNAHATQPETVGSYSWAKKSKGVFEHCTSTGSWLLALKGSGFCLNSPKNRLYTRSVLSNINLLASMHIPKRKMHHFRLTRVVQDDGDDGVCRSKHQTDQW